jgi:glycosyltransferase involved in cell wall biosynthesis
MHQVSTTGVACTSTADPIAIVAARMSGGPTHTGQPGDVNAPAVDVHTHAARLNALGIRRIQVLAWRDSSDPDAGGSEEHADQLMRRWAAAGLQIVQRTARADGQPISGTRDGYEVVRRGGRFAVFPRAVAAQLAGRQRHGYDALVEIWNGVPWFSPVWCRRPRVTFLHHVHGPMWDQVLPTPLAHVGRFVETTLAPRCYRGSTVITLAEESRTELIGLGFRSERVHVVSPGISTAFSPSPSQRAAVPTVVSVGRLAPVKRMPDLLAALLATRQRVPALQVEIVGEGVDRTALTAWIDAHEAQSWVTLRGRVTADALVDAYRRAWLVTSASLAEGWGMTVTEAAACGTPAVVTDTVGHRGSVADGVTGSLVAQPHDLGPAVADALGNPALLARWGSAALARSRSFTWDAAAAVSLGLLADEADRRAAR